jgi:hypothetical protein
MGFWEKLGGALGAFSNDNFEEGWKKYGSALDELFSSDFFSSDRGNASPRPRKWVTRCKKCGCAFRQIHATIEPDLEGIYSCPDCGQKGPKKNPNGWYCK